ncbi:MAG: hypothetical protein ACKVXR_04755 [Planctomycetota bacterium]
MSEDKAEPKIGAGHASAMFRLGLAELRAAVAFSESNVVQPSPYGIYGTKTPGEVQEERKSSSKDAGDDPLSVLDSRLGQDGRGGEDPNLEPSAARE